MVSVTPTVAQSSAHPLSGDLTVSSGICGHQGGICFTYIHIGTYTHKIKSLFSKKSNGILRKFFLFFFSPQSLNISEHSYRSCKEGQKGYIPRVAPQNSTLCLHIFPSWEAPCFIEPQACMLKQTELNILLYKHLINVCYSQKCVFFIPLLFFLNKMYIYA